MRFLEPVTGAWGLLPLAIPATIFVAMRLGGLVFPENAAHRAVGGSLLAIALIVVGVNLLGTMHLFTPLSAALALGAVTVALAFATRQPARRACVPVRAALTKDVLPMVLVAFGALVIAVLAARWLPVWQWDSLAYHLPFVNAFLQGHGRDGVPIGAHLIATYPHNVELFVVALRAMLPDDRLVDLAQVPLGILGAIAVGGIARLHGAERPYALLAGCAWLVVPAVFLQLPTDYVDVASAAFYLVAVYFVFAPPSRRALVVAGVALGLFLGTKPTAPPAAAVLGCVLIVRGLRAKLPGATVLAVLLAAALGTEMYLINLVRYGNPVWPVAMTIGPIHLPGTQPVDTMLDPSLARVQSTLPLPLRMLASWTDLTSPPTFDIRKGGYGLLFLVALPFAIVTLVRTRKVALWIAVAAIFLNPYPTWARFTLAFVGLTLAMAAPHLSRLQPRARTLLLGAAALVGAGQIAYAWRGLQGDGPELLAYASMSDEERAVSVGADGPPTKIMEARKRVRDDETFAFDHQADFAYLAWESDLRYRAVYFPNDLSIDRVGEFLAREKVRLFITDDSMPAGQWANAHPESVVRLFPCQTAPCAVYERR